MSKLTRRNLLGAGAAAFAAPYFVPSTVFGKDGGTAPSNKVTMGCIGLGWQGPFNMGKFLELDDCQVVAACDLDKNHLAAAADTVNKKYGNTDCKTYHDFHELLGRKDIDAVMIATPDHWHGIVAVSAANAGKDMWCEKPMGHTFSEQLAMVDAVHKNKRIWQTGSWQRSVFNFRQGVGLVTNGYIGKIKRVEVGLPSGHADFNGTGNDKPNSEPPAELDYDFWIGPSKMIPYNVCRSHKNWRWNYNTGGGQLMDWIGHHCDIAHWGLGGDDTLGPSEVEATAEFPPADAVWNTATKYRISAKYPRDIEFVIAGGHSDIQGGTKWIGETGWVRVDRGQFQASNPEWVKEANELDKKDGFKLKPYKSDNHWANFIQCVKSREKTITPAEVASRSATPGHLGYIASVLKTKINWDAAKQQIVGNDEAAKMLAFNPRSPWKI
jgi:predicted dehydrogenase